MYLYLAICPDMDTFNTQTYYQDFFTNASPRTIVETIMNVNKLDALNQPWPTSFIEMCIEKFDTILKLEIGILDIAVSTKTGLLSKVDNIRFGRFRKNLQNCLHENECLDIENYLQSLGYLQYNQNPQEFI